MNEIESYRKGIAETRVALEAALALDTHCCSSESSESFARECRLVKLRISLYTSEISELRRSLSLKRASMRAIQYVSLHPFLEFIIL